MSILYDSNNDEVYTVTNAPDITLLNSLGVFNGSEITKKGTYKMGGPVLIAVDNREVAIGKDIAVLIDVERKEV